jgi:hypothetical protein
MVINCLCVLLWQYNGWYIANMPRVSQNCPLRLEAAVVESGKKGQAAE